MASASGSQTFQLALVQMRCSIDPVENLTRAIEKIAEAGRRGADVVCLPELFRTQYFCQTEDHANFALAEPIPGPASEALCAAARAAKVTLVASLFERRAAGLYHNTAITIAPDGRIVSLPGGDLQVIDRGPRDAPPIVVASRARSGSFPMAADAIRQQDRTDRPPVPLPGCRAPR